MVDAKVLVGLTTAEYIRQATFIPSLLGLQRPEKSAVITVHGQSPAANRNDIIRNGLQHDFTHIFFMDDDMIFPPDTLMKLLAHGKDIVSALYLLRSFPHRPAFFDKAYDDGKCKYAAMTPEFKGLVKGVNAGLGAALISTKVFEKLEEPWIRLGEIEKDGWCDDIGFFNRCREAGYDVWCDLDAPVGHQSTTTIWPIHDGKDWYTEYKSMYGNIRFLQHLPTEREIDDEVKMHGVRELVRR